MSPLSQTSAVGPISPLRQPLSHLSSTPTNLYGTSDIGSARRSLDMGHVGLVEGSEAITSARRYSETAAQKRWKKLKSLIRGAKTLQRTLCGSPPSKAETAC